MFKRQSQLKNRMYGRIIIMINSFDFAAPTSLARLKRRRASKGHNFDSIKERLIFYSTCQCLISRMVWLPLSLLSDLRGEKTDVPNG